MNIEVTWADDAQTIIHWNFPAEYTWDDFDQARQNATAMAGSVPHKVCAICDVSALTMLPDEALDALPMLSLDSPENLLIIYMVGAIGHPVKLNRIFTRITGRVTFANSVEEARKKALNRLQAEG